MAIGTQADVAHKAWWQTFEVVFGIPFASAVALQLVAPLSVPPCFLTIVVVPAGIALVVGGVAFVVFARRELARHGQPTDPGHPTKKLVTSGVFSRSRNPLYLGGVCILVGIALGSRTAWGLILLNSKWAKKEHSEGARLAALIPAGILFLILIPYILLVLSPSLADGG